MTASDALLAAGRRLRSLRAALREVEVGAANGGEREREMLRWDAPRLREEIAAVEEAIRREEAARTPAGPMAILRQRYAPDHPVERVRRELARLLDARREAEGRALALREACEAAVSKLERRDFTPERERLAAALDTLRSLDAEIDSVGRRLRLLEVEASR
jgi:hypothetical protein